MKISTKGRYALRILVDLAQHRDKGFISLKEIAERQGVSKKYLEQIVPMLNRSDILLTNRGYQGGYMLAGEPKNHTVGKILRLTEGNLSPVSCVGDNPVSCDRSDKCSTLFVWQGLYNVINEYLDSITLQDIIDENNARGIDNYII